MKLMAGFTIVAVFAMSGSSNAATIQATDFLYAAGSGTYDGTTSNPWPEAALEAAIASAQGGDVVVLANGTWSITSSFQTTQGDITIEGQAATPYAPASAQVVFSPGAYWMLGSLNTLTSNLKITGLTFDGSQITGYINPIQVWNCANCTVAGNVIIGTNNGSVAAMLFYGGFNNRIAGNSILAGTGTNSGGAQLQVNAQSLGGSLPVNTGYDIDGNYFDSSNLLVIGIGNLHIHNNTFTDQTAINGAHVMVQIMFVAQSGGTTRNIVIDSNVLDTYIPGYGWGNDAAISGVSTGLTQGTIEGLVIANNVIQALIATVAVNYSAATNPEDTTAPLTYYLSVTDNKIYSAGQGATIDLRGGTNGAIGSATVQGNILQTGTLSTTPNVILTDTNTSNVNCANNLGVSCG